MSVTNPPRVMKADSAREFGSKIAFNYDDLEQRCEVYLESVRQQARDILSAAVQEVEVQRHELIAAAELAGYQAGQARAETEFEARVQAAAETRAVQKVQTILPAFKSACDQLQQQALLLQQEAEATLISLSVAIAERLVRQTIAVQPQVTLQLIRETLQLAGRSDQVELQLHPEDLALLSTGSLASAMQQVCGGRSVHMVANSELSRGGCVVQTALGTIDASWETQLARITAELLGES